MRTSILLLLIFGLSCSTKDNGQNMTSQPIEEFWTWFIKNEEDLKNFEKDPDKYLNKILTQIVKIQEGLAVELEPSVGNIIGMTISADGDYTLFPIVERIYEKAPVLEGWKFYAFRQRAPIEKVKEFVLSNGEQELKVEDMKFAPIIENDSLDILVFVKGLTEENKNEIAYGGLLLLDNILGEYDCVTKVRHYDFQAMPQDLRNSDLRPLYEVADFVDKFAAAK